MEKLEHLKEINKQFSDMEDTKSKIRSKLKDDQDEETFMQYFQKEKERLAGERDELIECLKQIDIDINAMDSIIVQTENERHKSFEATRRLVEDYRQRKLRINKLRSQLSLPSLDSDDFLENLDTAELKNGSSNEWPATSQQDRIRGQMMNNSALSMLNKQVSKPLTSKTNALNFGHHHHSDQNLPALGERRAERSLSSATFLQQPPPMKTCMSCTQQIHRNAPICPYCKAKSRSRNPKKPKRKVDA